MKLDDRLGLDCPVPAVGKDGAQSDGIRDFGPDTGGDIASESEWEKRDRFL